MATFDDKQTLWEKQNMNRNNKPARESVGLSDLLACPFCGGEAHITLTSRGYRVECKNRWNLPECPMNMRTHHHDKKEDVIKAWNTRAS